MKMAFGIFSHRMFVVVKNINIWLNTKVANVFSSVVQRSLDTEDPTRSLMYDSIPVVYALHHEIFTTVTASVEVECGSELCDGMTVCEPVKPEGRRCWSNAPKIHKVVLDVDREAYVEAVKRILRESEY